MAPSEVLSSEVVCSALADWRRGDLSDEQMHFWAINNYFPAHQVVAPNEPDHVALAIGIVLTEFECTKPPYKFDKAVAANALALIDSDAKEFEARKAIFFDSLREYKHAL
jgi:hypothetical protein